MSSISWVWTLLRNSLYSEFGEGATYPQIAIGLRHIGNLNETLKHFNYTGKL